VVVPSPSWPELFMPHAQMVPSVLRAYVDWPPAAIAVMPVIAIDVGVTRVNVVPSPSWPYALYPHAHTVPESVSTTTWLEPAATAGRGRHRPEERQRHRQREDTLIHRHNSGRVRRMHRAHTAPT